MGDGLAAGWTPNPQPAGAAAPSWGWPCHVPCAACRVPRAACHSSPVPSASGGRRSAPGGAHVGRTSKHCCANGESGGDGGKAQSQNGSWMPLLCRPLFSEKWPVSSTSETLSVHREGSLLLLYQFTLMRLEKLTRRRYRSFTNDSSLFRLPRVM